MSYTDNSTGGRIVEGVSFPMKITLADSCLPGDLLGISSATWVRSLATVTTVVHPFLVAGQKGASGDVITAYSAAIVRGVTDAAVGGYVYTAEGSDKGSTTQTQPTTTGDVDAPIGFALSTTAIFLCPGSAGIIYADADHLHA